MLDIQDSRAVIGLIPYILSFLFSVGIGIFAWGRRTVVGASEMAAFTWAQASMTLGFIFELLSQNIEDKLFWDNIQFIGMFIGPLAFYMFAQSYTGKRLSSRRMILAIATIVIFFFLVMVFTNPFHHLVYTQAQIVPGFPFSSLVYTITPVFWVMLFFVYSLFFAGLYLMLGQLPRSPRIYRLQVLTILMGVLVILVGSFLFVSRNIPLFQRDVTPFLFIVSNLCLTWGLSRYQLLGVVPVAHHSILQSITDAVVVLDTRGRVIDMNASAEKLAGKPMAEVAGHAAQEIFRALPDLDEILSSESEVSREIEVLIGGNRITLDVRFSTLLDESRRRRGQVILLRDVSKMKQSEVELKQRTAQLEQANRKLEATNTRLHILSRAKDEFVSNVSHELRTPISNLKLYIDLLRIRPENQERYLQTLERETNRLEEMIESLLMLSRLDQERVAFRYQSVDLNDLVKEYIQDRYQLAEIRGLRLEWQEAPGLPRVRADRGLIGQVLSILLTNALNYTPEGGLVSVTTKTRQQAGQVWAGFTVKDTGRGIPEDEQKQIFSRFFRGSAAREAEVAGTGLGLAISKEIVTRHQGEMEVSSRGVPGMGAQFTVWLPAQLDLEEPFED